MICRLSESESTKLLMSVFVLAASAVEARAKAEKMESFMVLYGTYKATEWGQSVSTTENSSLNGSLHSPFKRLGSDRQWYFVHAWASRK